MEIHSFIVHACMTSNTLFHQYSNQVSGYCQLFSAFFVINAFVGRREMKNGPPCGIMLLEKGKVDMMEQLTTQQMERVAMLQLRNQIWMVALIIWGCLLLLILLLCALQFYLDLRRRARQSSDTLTLTCEHCSRSFPVPLAHFYRHPFLPKKKRACTGRHLSSDRTELSDAMPALPPKELVHTAGGRFPFPCRIAAERDLAQASASLSAAGRRSVHLRPALPLSDPHAADTIDKGNENSCSHTGTAVFILLRSP